MIRRLDKTLADYVAIAISPVLIMLLVGSLLFFLVDVFYQGDYPGRMVWILGWFTVAIVLIGRISIEEGRERAVLFAVPLALVTAVAINHFVQFRGGLLGRYNVIVNLILMAIIWWSAHKLTWDCTLIDEAEDASGEGLMQTVGLDEKAANAPQPQPEEPKQPEPEGVTSRDEKPLSWLERLLEREKRPHAPGVWVVYFSLAALPLFGMGQWFVPSGDLERRRYVFTLLLVYVASGLGLLLTTSFLGLRRYLRQRHVEMPARMAGAWIAIGCAFIVAVLALAALLPRPNAEYEIARLPFEVGSPTRHSSRHDVLGGEAADEDQGGRRSGTQEGERESDSERTDRGEDSRPGDDSGGEGGRSKSEAQDGTSGSGEKAEQSGSGTKSQDADSGSDSKSQQGGSSSQGKQQGSSSGSGKQQKGSPSGSKQDGERSQSGSQGDDQRAESRSEQGDDQRAESRSDQGDDRSRRDSGQDDQAERSGSKSQQRGSRSGAGQDRDRSRSGSQERQEESRSRWASRMRDRESGEEDAESDEAESQTAQDDSAGANDRQQRSFDPGAILRGANQWITAVVKWIIYAILIGVAAFWVWRSRHELLAALKGLLAGWREFWARLFGGRRAPAEATAGAEEGPRERPPRPFSDFPNPFTTGLEHRFSADELVQYTFEALEAWGREHACPREPDQTPHEFAHEIGARVESLSQDVRRLADLYCRVAYSPGTLPRDRAAPLQQLWRRLNELAWAPV